MLLCLASPAAAELGRWTPIGPEAPGVVLTIAIDPHSPTTLYAGTQESGVFKSTDGGASWQPKSLGLEGFPSIHHLLVDPQNPSTLYTSHRNSKSVDGGETWFQNPPFAGGSGPTAIDPQTPSTVYAAPTYFGAFKSSNGGATWQEIALDLGIVDAIVVDPQSSAVVYAFVQEGGLFKSVDGAATWNAINAGLTSPAIAALAIDAGAPATMYVAALSEYDDDGNRLTVGGVFKTTDGGTTWNPSGTGLENRSVTRLVVHPQETATLYAFTYPLSVFRSTDAGASWSACGALPDVIRTVSTLVVDPVTPATLYLGTDQGVVKSVDAGATWTAANAGFTQLHVTAIDVAASDPPAVYAGTYRDGVFKSTDRGASWSAVNTGLAPAGIFGVQIDALAVDPLTPSRLYALIQASRYGPFQSTDAGASWAGFPFDPFGGSLYCVATLAVDPLDPGIVYAGMRRGGVCAGGVLRSVDGGPWTPTAAPPIRIAALALDPITPGTLYIGSDDYQGFHKSTDGGASWTTATELAHDAVTAIAVDPLHAGVVHVATEDGIRTSTDGGAQWSPVSLPFYQLPVLLIDPRNSDVLYAAGAGVQRSIDGGATWVPLYDGLVDLSVETLALDPGNPSELYAGTRGSSAYRIDLGASCTVDAECDDHDPCTVDACEASPSDVAHRCVQRPRTGLDGVTCAFSVRLADGQCAGERTLARYARVLTRGHARLTRATASASSARVARLLTAAADMSRRGTGVAEQALRRGRLGADCGAVVLDVLAAAESRARRHASRLRALE